MHASMLKISDEEMMHRDVIARPQKMHQTGEDDGKEMTFPF
jgi:hypothetical protein